MLDIQKEQKGSVLVVRLSGSVEEGAGFERIGATGGEIHVYCKGISRINSIGIKAWIKYFDGLRAAGANLKFFECSPAIVDQVNMLSNFVPKGSVESVAVPYACGGCRTELLGVIPTAQVQKLNFNLPPAKCPKCGGAATFDDLADEYFAFLTS